MGRVVFMAGPPESWLKVSEQTETFASASLLSRNEKARPVKAAL